MRTFLTVNKKPLIEWSLLPLNTYYEGVVPDGYKLAINPSSEYIILDVDVDKYKDKNGFNNIPKYSKIKQLIYKLFLIKKQSILNELQSTYHYNTKRGGKHYWLKYSGNKKLMNKASNLSIDLRIGPEIINNKIINNGGYVIYYPANQGDNIRNHLNEIKETSPEMNLFLEKLFC